MDLSFCHIGLDGIPPLLRVLSQRERTGDRLAVDVEVEGPSASKMDASSETTADAHPLELSLRECSLGDAGVALLAQSPWVCGPRGAKVLSLRNNQVTPCPIDRTCSNKRGGNILCAVEMSRDETGSIFSSS